MIEMKENIKDGEQTDKILTDLPGPIRGIIANLRETIDQLNSNFKSAKESIIELARRLDEDSICERSKISRLIKHVLKDKILEGKITAKWIEDCLPEEYKRNYSKSEQNSLSKKAKKLQEMVVDNSGKVSAELVSPNGLQKEQSENLRYGYEGGCPKCSELEEALRKASKISTAEQLAESEIKVPISKDKYKEIKSAMQESRDFFYIICDSTNRTFVCAELELEDLIIVH